MQIACPVCTKTLEFSGERPRFCAFCGQSLTGPTPAPTTPADPELTAPPSTIVDAGGERGSSTSHPETIGGYRLLRRLGGGGMGAVYEAQEIASGRHVALKLVLPEFAGSSDTLTRFRQEGRVASTLVHPRCVFVLAADEEAGRPYIVMELMPGATLDDLVRERGPLPVEEALAKILDIIDGLEEAHRRGLVHRDVKPSNCFLEANGRVKVGDFGLARSLVGDTKLTRTGAFIGTPLYAAPEQIHKNEPTDAQSDIYSVAATLYFLLTAQAPFQSAGDAMTTLARIVADNPPPMRTVRPSLPRALDKVVLRGLERDRRRRWKDLGEMRRALLPFLPAQPSVGGLGLRFGAFLIDTLALITVGLAVGFFIRFGGPYHSQLAPMLIGIASGSIVNVLYFSTLEGFLGRTLGKWLLRLRVGTPGGAKAPGLVRGFARSATFYVLMNGGGVVTNVLLVMADVMPGSGSHPAEERHLIAAGLGALSILLQVLGIVAIMSTMRPRNGYRGLHEFITGTRTYYLRWPKQIQRRAVRQRAFDLAVTRPDALPEHVGAFTVRGALAWTDHERTLLAEDPRLGRSLWLYLRSVSAPPLDPVQHAVDRATRVRWVTGGTDDGWQWDAFLAPTGMPLPVLASGKPRLGWGEMRVILEDLSEELAAACSDGTLPRALTAQQVWVQPDGRVQLLTLPVEGDCEPSSAPTDQERALQLLRAVAVVGFEGTARPIRANGDRVRAPVPVHAEEMLDRLLGNRQPFTTVAEVRQDLELVRDRPAEVSRTRRASHLAMMLLFLHIPFAGPVVLLIGSFLKLREAGWQFDNHLDYAPFMSVEFATLSLVCGFWVVWAFVCRGGYMFWRGGIVLRRADGRKASRLQCGLRALLVWALVFTLYCVAFAVAMAVPQLPEAYFAIWGLGTLLLPLYAVMATAFPQRSLHDRIAGTYLMPA
jgi:eukaryotic-like serine/threonine-protein kinase